MSDERLETVDLPIGGTTYHLRISLGALADVAELHPVIDPIEALDNLFQRKGEGEAATIRVKSLPAVRVLFWAALRYEQPDLPLAEANRLMDTFRKGGGSIFDLAVACWGAWEVGGARPEADQSKNADGPTVQ
jgi:hypothetical protein